MPVFTSSIELSDDYPSIQPSLNLNFARSRALDPRITFTRSTVGTYVNENGQIKTAVKNEPRFDHDPVTLESLGLFLEGSRTNIIYGGPGQASIVATSGQANSLTGNNDAYKLRKDSPSSNSQSNGSWSLDGTVSTTSYVMSIFVKKINHSKFFMQTVVSSADNLYVYFDIDTGVTSHTDYTAQGNLTVTPSIETYRDGWYRLICRVEGSAGNTLASGFRFGFSDPTTGAQQYINSDDEVLVYGAQIENGEEVSSYIPTADSTSAVSRGVDFAVILGNSFSSFYNPDGWTIDFIFRVRTSEQNGSNYRFWDINDNTGDDRLGAYYAVNGATNYYGQTSGSPGFSSSGNVVIVLNQEYHGALAFSPASTIAFHPGTESLGTEDTTVVLNDPTQLQIGNWFQNDRGMFGTISKLVYYPKRLSNAQLLSITS